MQQFPMITEALIEALEKRFPDKSPRLATITPTQVGMLIGNQQVMDFLRAQYARQNPMEGK